MAWVNRTTRDQGPGMQNNATHLGPGVYETSPTRRVRPNAAAFGSSVHTERGSGGAGESGTMGHPTFVTPGPGAYTGTSNQTPWESPMKTQTSGFQSKTQRVIGGIRTGHDSTPGPGAYIKQNSFGVKKKKNRYVQLDPSLASLGLRTFV